MRRRSWSCGFVAVVVLGLVAAQAPDPWVGRRVVPRETTPLMMGSRVVDDGSRRRVYTVEAVNGTWLWVAADGVNGWVRSDSVVRTDQAVEYFTSRIRTRPRDPGLYLGRGLAWAERGELDKAIADFSQVIQLDPKSVDAYRNRGDAWDDKDKAIADYTAAIKLDPKDAQAFRNRGFSWLAKREYAKALADYDEAIKLDPKYVVAYNGRAWIWATCPEEKYRDGKRAVESATKACELTGWKDPSPLDTLAAASAEAGDFAAAVKWQTKALELLPKDDEALRADSASRLALYRAGKPYREPAETK